MTRTDEGVLLNLDEALALQAILSVFSEERESSMGMDIVEDLSSGLSEALSNQINDYEEIFEE